MEAIVTIPDLANKPNLIPEFLRNGLRDAGIELSEQDLGVLQELKGLLRGQFAQDPRQPLPRIPETFSQPFDVKSTQMAAYMAELLQELDIEGLNTHETPNKRCSPRCQQILNLISRLLKAGLNAGFLAFFIFCTFAGPVFVYWDANQAYDLWNTVANPEAMRIAAGMCSMVASYGPAIFSLIHVFNSTVTKTTANQNTFNNGQLGILTKSILWAMAVFSSAPYLNIFMKSTGGFEITSADILPFISIIGMETIENAWSVLALILRLKTPEKISGLSDLDNSMVDYLRQKMLSAIQTALNKIRRTNTLDEELILSFPKILGENKGKLTLEWIDSWFTHLRNHEIAGFTIVDDDFHGSVAPVMDTLVNNSISQCKTWLTTYQKDPAQVPEPILMLFRRNINGIAGNRQSSIKGAHLFQELLSNAAGKLGQECMIELLSQGKIEEPKQPDSWRTRFSVSVTVFRISATAVGLGHAGWDTFTIIGNFISSQIGSAPIANVTDIANSTFCNITSGNITSIGNSTLCQVSTDGTNVYGFILKVGVWLIATVTVGWLIAEIQYRVSNAVYDAASFVKNKVYPVFKNESLPYRGTSRILLDQLYDHCGPYPRAALLCSLLCLGVASISFAANDSAASRAATAFAFPYELVIAIRAIAIEMPIEVNTYGLIQGCVIPLMKYLAKGGPLQCCRKRGYKSDITEKKQKLLDACETLDEQLSTMSDENILRLIQMLKDHEIARLLRNNENGNPYVSDTVMEKLFEKMMIAAAQSNKVTSNRYLFKVAGGEETTQKKTSSINGREFELLEVADENELVPLLKGTKKPSCWETVRETVTSNCCVM